VNPASGQTVLSNGGPGVAWVAAGATFGVGSGATPRTTLDVQGTPPAGGVTEAHHVGVIQNLSTASGTHMLAVRSAAGNVSGCNFITFLDGADNEIGSIAGAQVLNSSLQPENFVTYNSYLAADYAEAAPRDPATPPIAAGSVVGLRNGVVSLATEGAECLFVTTDRPALLGNAPPAAQRTGYEMLAFIGQVPVLVTGPVRPGDLIVASGRDDGAGRAVAPDDLGADELALVVGQAARGSSAAEGALQRVNALVGPGIAHAAAAKALLVRQAREIERQARELRQHEAQLKQQAARVARGKPSASG
jgi:hypothetical protein